MGDSCSSGSKECRTTVVYTATSPISVPNTASNAKPYIFNFGNSGAGPDDLSIGSQTLSVTAVATQANGHNTPISNEFASPAAKAGLFFSQSCRSYPGLVSVSAPPLASAG
jgi:hypothetical protein